MKFEDLMSMTLGDVLEEYCVLYNLECGYVYGVASNETVDWMYEKYNVEEYSEAMSPEPLIQFEVLDELQSDLVSEEKISRIMDNLGINKKK